MATTDEGRALTDEHRVAQVQIGAEAIGAAALTWQVLDLDDVDRSSRAWVQAQVDVVRDGFERSAATGAVYVDAHRAAEGVTGLPGAFRPAFNAAAAEQSFYVSGVIVAKAAISRGMDPAAAFSRSRGYVLGATQQWTLSGGRQSVIGSVRAARTKWRRVSDGHPCAFCAMLVARTATDPMSYRRKPDFRTHERCGCTVEEVVGSYTPTDLEQQWIDAYDEAASQAALAGEPIVAPHGSQRRDTVLWRMRRGHPDLFHDGVYPRN